MASTVIVVIPHIVAAREVFVECRVRGEERARGLRSPRPPTPRSQASSTETRRVDGERRDAPSLGRVAAVVAGSSLTRRPRSRPWRRPGTSCRSPCSPRSGSRRGRPAGPCRSRAAGRRRRRAAPAQVERGLRHHVGVARVLAARVVDGLGDAVLHQGVVALDAEDGDVEVRRGRRSTSRSSRSRGSCRTRHGRDGVAGADLVEAVAALGVAVGVVIERDLAVRRSRRRRSP